MVEEVSEQSNYPLMSAVTLLSILELIKQHNGTKKNKSINKSWIHVIKIKKIENNSKYDEIAKIFKSYQSKRIALELTRVVWSQSCLLWKKIF
jgi:hypothetical protein